MAAEFSRRAMWIGVICAAATIAAGCVEHGTQPPAVPEEIKIGPSALPDGFDADRAIARMDKEIAATPDNALLYVARSVLYADGKKDCEQALRDLDKAIALAPDYAPAWYIRGLMQGRLGRNDEAIRDLSKAIELDPKMAWAYFNRGSVYRVARRDFNRAMEDYNRAIELDPSLSQAYMGRAMLHLASGDRVGARTEYSLAIKGNPKNAMAFYDRGIIDWETRAGDLGVADYTAAIALNPRYSEAYCNRGMSYAVMRKYDLAIADFGKAIELDPRDFIAYHERGLAYLEGRHDLTQGLADMDRAIQADPSRPMAHWNKAGICEQLGRRDEALAEYKKVLDLPASPGQIQQASARIRALEAAPK